MYFYRICVNDNEPGCHFNSCERCDCFNPNYIHIGEMSHKERDKPLMELWIELMKGWGHNIHWNLLYTC